VTIPRGVNKWCHRVRACLWALGWKLPLPGKAQKLSPGWLAARAVTLGVTYPRTDWGLKLLSL
jgi:hypothetical protein